MFVAVACLFLPYAYLSAQNADYVTTRTEEAQVSAATTSEKNVGTEVSETESSAPARNQAESSITLSSAAKVQSNSDGSAKKGGSNTFLVFLRMILVLAIVVAIIWIIFKLLQKSTGGSSSRDDKFLRKVSSISVSPGKSVQVITLVDRAFLIGVADGSVSLLCEIEDPELISAMNLYADKNSTSSKPKNFGEVLEIFMPKKKNLVAKKNVFEDGAAQQILDSLKKQSDRMSKGE